jgi:hypothetical protein
MLTMAWQKSSLSSGNTDNCVEARLAGDGVEVRHSKNPDGPAIAFTRDEWTAFTGGAKLGEFDL